ncbi:D-alanyl-D-alanine carboxypeptidase [Anaerocolumna sp. AGMB13025]|uniref:serine hydrolase n=1 Tax=Anaerocolumna sp. AGMB13025 TaxID=3039116 RepID=UPI00241C2CEA|nr:serine hydrolase [Anaerocolumna sp. AGMB13025]WFR54751.1 D-alanyl-D-alanine carboxypeptidase [Anaerocolumna sp. AGMB13025]
MKKKLICILMSLAFLTGCSNSSKALLPYSETNNVIRYENNIGTEVSDFFARDLTVIPDELNHMEDPSITATSALIVNDSDDVVLYANNVYERMYPASLTKLITALVVLKEGNLSDTVTVSYNASHITESGAKLCGFKEGDKISMEVLLNSLLVYSGNDAGIAIAEHIGGTVEGFADKMNETAKSIGAVHSHFVNPHGLHDDNHYTTAYDLYLIFNALLKYDKFVSIINQESYTAIYKDAQGQEQKKELATTDRYLKGTEKAPEGVTVVGGKTGTTSKAGNCLILYSKDKKNKSYISLILQADGSNSLFSQMTHLLEKIK